MKLRGVRRGIVPAFAALIGASAGAHVVMALGGHAQAQPAYQPRPGEGVICAWGLYVIALEVGRRCFPGENPELQSELAGSVARIDAYVVRNSESTQADLDQFKRRHGHIEDGDSYFCRSDPMTLYRNLRTAGVERLRADTDELLARPGPPSWGDCL